MDPNKTEYDRKYPLQKDRSIDTKMHNDRGTIDSSEQQSNDNNIINVQLKHRTKQRIKKKADSKLKQGPKIDHIMEQF